MRKSEVIDLLLDVKIDPGSAITNDTCKRYLLDKGYFSFQQMHLAFGNVELFCSGEGVPDLHIPYASDDTSGWLDAVAKFASWETSSYRSVTS